MLSENEAADTGGSWSWYGYGGLQPQANFGADWFIATRSAFGIRADGNLVFAAGHHISTKDMAKALALAGCERAIHGDANPHNVLGNIYHVGGDGLIVRKSRLSPEQKTYTLDRYVDRSYTSDFFGFFIWLASESAPARAIVGTVAQVGDSPRDFFGFFIWRDEKDSS